MKKNLNKLATLALTGAMVAGMSFGAMAATNVAYNGGVMTKAVMTDGKTYAPNTTFSFTVSEVKSVDGISTEKMVVTKGKTVADYLKPTTGNQAKGVHVGDITFSGADKNLGAVLDNGTNGFKGTSAITVDAGTFTEPGIYVFSVKENEGNYEGISYSKAEYYLLVVVQNAETGDDLVVSQVSMSRKSDGTKLTTFYNNYGCENVPENPDPENPDKPEYPSDDKVWDLKISKEITGLGANKSGEFHFTVSVVAADGSTDTDYRIYTVDGDAETFKQDASSDAALTVTNGTTYHIYGLTEGDTVTLKETEAGQNGYTATYTMDGVEQETTNGTLDATNGVAINAKKNNATAKVTNEKTQIAITGVAMNIAPYAAMVLGAGAFAGIFLGMKKKDEE